jgi:hypothetical protein
MKVEPSSPPYPGVFKVVSQYLSGTVGSAVKTSLSDSRGSSPLPFTLSHKLG